MSSIVSNPYSFNISKNTGFSSSIQAILPNDNQSLFSDSDDTIGGGQSAYIQKNIELKIPNGVNVIYIEADVYATSDDPYSLNDGSIFITNTENNKKWVSESESVRHNDIAIYIRNYIGVTPGKIYKLKISIQAAAELDPCNSNVSLDIYYSALINQKTPDILDY